MPSPLTSIASVSLRFCSGRALGKDDVKGVTDTAKASNDSSNLIDNDVAKKLLDARGRTRKCVEDARLLYAKV